MVMRVVLLESPLGVFMHSLREALERVFGLSLMNVSFVCFSRSDTPSCVSRQDAFSCEAASSSEHGCPFTELC